MIGDLDANIEQLKAQLRQVRFPLRQLDAQGLARGRPEASLPILHYALVDLSPPLSKHLSEKGYELRSKSDLRFLEGAFRVLREHLGYSPILTTAQFLSEGFAERKVLLCQDVLGLARRAHGELSGHPMLPGRAVRRSASAGDSRLRHSLDDGLGEPQAPPTPFPPVEQERCATAHAAGSAVAGGGDSSRGEPAGVPRPAQRPRAVAGAAVAPEELTNLCSGRAPAAEGAASEDLLGPISALQRLLEEIRQSLHQRMDRLEKRLEVHIERAEARTTMLEGEMRLLLQRPRACSEPQAPPRVRPAAAAVAPAPGAAEFCSRAVGGGGSRAESAEPLEATLDRISLGGPWRPSAAAADGHPWCQAETSPLAAAGSHAARGATAALAAPATPTAALVPTALLAVPTAAGPVAPAPEGAAARSGAAGALAECAGGSNGVLRGASTALLPHGSGGAAAEIEPDAEALMTRLAEKYRDSRQLLARAQEQIGRASQASAGHAPTVGSPQAGVH